MLQKKHRLSKKQFDSIMSQGKAIHSPFFTFVYSLNKAESMGLVSVAPKKISKTAVERNKIRRRIYGSIERVIGNTLIPIQGIFLAKAGVIKVDYKSLDEGVRQIFVKLGFLK